MIVRDSAYKFCKVHSILAISLSLDLVSLNRFPFDFVFTRYIRIKEVSACLYEKNSACFSN